MKTDHITHKTGNRNSTTIRANAITARKGVMAFYLTAALFMTTGESVATSMKAHTDMEAKDPATAPVVAVDRFGPNFAHLLTRTSDNGLPGPNEPVDFDKAPFITHGLSPNGQMARYYNFDVQSTTPAPIYVLFREGEDTPVKGQLNVVDVIPGDEGYNDFWQVHKVTVPANYVANSITDYQQIIANKLSVAKTDTLVNCPVVPDGSTAKLRTDNKSAELQSGWYKGKVVKYFTFEEKALSTSASNEIPLSPIYVTFNINPDQPNGGPSSGFRVESNGVQTHNVLQTTPKDAGYSPLWSVNVYDNKDWASVRNLQTVLQTTTLANAVATVNCPVVYVDSKIAKLELK